MSLEEFLTNIIQNQSSSVQNQLKKLFLDLQIFCPHRVSFDSFQAFKVLRNFTSLDQKLKDLLHKGEFQKAFFVHWRACGSRCLNCHPLYQALRIGNEAEISYLVAIFHRVLTFPCECITSWKISEALHQALLQFPALRNLHSRLDCVWKLAEPYSNDSRVINLQRKREFVEVIENYYLTGSDFEAVKRIVKHPFLTDEDLKFLLNEYTRLTYKSYKDYDLKLQRILPEMSRKDLIRMVDLISNANQYQYFKPYMTQEQRNEMLWRSVSRTFNLSIKFVVKQLEFGGDIYSIDCKGNPWIIAILANVHWKNRDHNKKLCAENLSVGISLQNSREIYQTSKRYDKWRIETHRNRCKRFKAITMTLLLCIRRYLVMSLPDLCIIRIMEKLVEFERSAVSIETDELDASHKLTLSGLYYETYGRDLFKLAIIRRIRSIKIDESHLAQFLANDTFERLKSTWGGIDYAITMYNQLVATLHQKYKNAESLRDKMEAEGLDWRGPHENNNVKTVYERLAFHEIFGFKLENQPYDTESFNKKLKLETGDL